MNNEFNKILMALSGITLKVSNLDTKCKCKELSDWVLKDKESVMKLEAMIETKKKKRNCKSQGNYRHLERKPKHPR